MVDLSKAISQKRYMIRPQVQLMTNRKQEALLMQRNRASTLSLEIVQNATQMFDGLHLRRSATCE